MLNETQIKELLEEHKAEYKRYSNNILEFLDNINYVECDYVQHQRIMASYHRGSINALMKVLK